MKRYVTDDRGAVAVTVAILLVVLVLFAAIAVDLGYLFTAKRQLQTAADAAALAGCRVLIDGGNEGEVREESRVYAEDENANNPGDDLYVELTETDMATYVQVTVAKDAPLFFGRLIAPSSMVRAVARAEVAYVAGLGGVMPWGLLVSRSNPVTVSLGGGPEVELSSAGGGLWTGTIQASDVRREAGYPLRVTLWNSQTYPDPGLISAYPDGVPQMLENAAAVVVPPDPCPIKDLWLDPPVVLPGQSFTLHVRSITQPQRESITPGAGGTWVAMTQGDLLDPLTGLRDYTWTSTAPGEVELNAVVVSQKISVRAPFSSSAPPGGNAPFEGVTLDPAAYLIVRRSSYPILNVRLGSEGNPEYFVQPNATIPVSVRINDFYYGERYPMRLDSGAGTVGNFGAIDLSTIRHTPYWQLSDPLEYVVEPNVDQQSIYLNALRTPFPYVIHIGDSVWSLQLVSTGAAAEGALTERFDGDNRTWDQWQADLADEDPTNDSSKRIVLVPILELMCTEDYPTGAPVGWIPYRVVSLAYFFIEETPTSGSENTIVGRFIEYARPTNDIIEDPSDDLAVKTVRLVPPQ